MKVGSQACMTCHDSAEKAPATMVALYGNQNGFGWKVGDIVAAQVVSIPLSVPMAARLQDAAARHGGLGRNLRGDPAARRFPAAQACGQAGGRHFGYGERGQHGRSRRARIYARHKGRDRLARGLVQPDAPQPAKRYEDARRAELIGDRPSWLTMSDIPTTIGRYQVKRWLASGAMGEVYEAYDPIIDRPVAIKMLRRELVERGDSVGWLERFRHEARAAGRRMHPNIVTVLDFGEQEGTPYLAMEYVAGENVDAALKGSGPFDEARAVSIITQVLSALEFAHAEGVIHRDIKPSNILLPKSGPIKVADFGIAHLETSDLTIDGDVLGTPSYMAPEQLLGGQIDHRADLYAAGLLFFEMLTGEKAFKNRQIFDLVRNMREREPADIWAKHREVSPTADRDHQSRAGVRSRRAIPHRRRILRRHPRRRHFGDPGQHASDGRHRHRSALGDQASGAGD